VDEWERKPEFSCSIRVRELDGEQVEEEYRSGLFPFECYHQHVTVLAE